MKVSKSFHMKSALEDRWFYKKLELCSENEIILISFPVAKKLHVFFFMTLTSLNMIVQ